MGQAQKPPTRFAVRMSYELAADFDEIEQEHGLSRCEIFRRAMALYKLAKENDMNGGNFILRHSDGKLRLVVGI
jgi:metal-responsive CopG/Arc/MetJ family transcriptional regulator